MNNSRAVTFLQFQLPVIAWGTFIVIVSSIPSQNLTSFGGYSDKVVHLSVFGIFCWLTHVALFFQTNNFLRKYSLLIAILFTAFFGFTDEYHQMFTPGRFADPFDLLADTCGGLVYAAAVIRFKFYRNE